MSPSAFWQGRYYVFISLVHEAVVVAWLLWLPFGKFFPIVERPATIGVTLCQTVSADDDRAHPGRPGSTFPLGFTFPLPQLLVLGSRLSLDECGSSG